MMQDVAEPRKDISRAFFQMLLIVVISAAAALGNNVIRTSPVPLIGDWSNEARLTTEEGEQLMVSLEDAKMFFKEQGAVFVDARNREAYDLGHIEGALSLPWHQAQELFMDVVPEMNPDVPVITYCDGEFCELSHDLAFFLKDLGFNVRVLVNGWSMWLESGMPVEGNTNDGV